MKPTYKVRYSKKGYAQWKYDHRTFHSLATAERLIRNMKKNDRISGEKYDYWIIKTHIMKR